MRIFVNSQSVAYDQWHPVSDLSGLQVSWDPEPGAYYTLAIYDIDAPREETHYSSPFIHLLVTNIPGSDISRGEVSAAFMLPSPLRGSGEHRYVIDLYQQTVPVKEAPVAAHRRRFRFADFVSRHGLHHVDTDVLVVDPNTMMFYLREPEWQITFNPHHPLIKKDAPLNEGEVKFCSCVVDVAVKNPEECNLEHAWPNKLPGGKCYSPFQVCASTIGTTSHHCYQAYNYNEFNETQLHALANLNGIRVDPSMTRDAVVNAIIRHPTQRTYV
jgi:hypothetical protein